LPAMPVVRLLFDCYACCQVTNCVLCLLSGYFLPAMPVVRLLFAWYACCQVTICLLCLLSGYFLPAMPVFNDCWTID